MSAATATRPMYYDTLRSYYRTELGVRMVLHVKRGGYTEIVATGGYSDAATVWDHTVYASDRERERDLRLWLRRHARWAMADAARRGYEVAR